MCQAQEAEQWYSIFPEGLPSDRVTCDCCLEHRIFLDLVCEEFIHEYCIYTISKSLPLKLFHVPLTAY